MLSSFFRHFREGFLGITRHFAMAFSSASAVSITLVLIGMVLLISANLSHITRNIEQNVEILVKIDNSATEVSIEYLQNEIKKIPGVLTVRFSSKDSELERFIVAYGENYAVYRGANNPMRNALYVKVEKGEMLEEVAVKIRAMQYVEATNYGGVNTVKMVKTMEAINVGVYVAAAVFSLLAVFLISNTIKITIYGRNKEISIMRHVGATNSFIRTPFVIEGVFIGILGCIFPIAIIVFGYRYLYQVMNGHLLIEMLEMAPTWPLAAQISLYLLAIGSFVGLIGSFVSVSRYLKFKR